jgi:hypothetical protein
MDNCMEYNRVCVYYVGGIVGNNDKILFIFMNKIMRCKFEMTEHGGLDVLE